ncbi:hypothetical protein K435DRAFT_792324 [Dendrothele bispora CBS 962.96]|uniref:Uncharacterized protein n=1 Tax=Dendrothele bispora (strain CBS 962.96) TaxID=1314807 RepID=A0A4S8MJJ3_DENBC|nr:hypothetical protein K435DRAFT_792324 [Dendrothele bispora CBS 962.96]
MDDSSQLMNWKKKREHGFSFPAYYILIVKFGMYYSYWMLKFQFDFLDRWMGDSVFISNVSESEGEVAVIIDINICTYVLEKLYYRSAVRVLLASSLQVLSKLHLLSP